MKESLLIRIVRGARAVVAIEGVLLVAVVLLVYLGVWEKFLGGMAQFYSVTVLFAGLLVAWRFGRSRLFFSLVVLTATDRALILAADLNPVQQQFLFHFLTIAVPANFLWFSIIRERGVLSGAGGLRIGVLLAQGVVAFLGVVRFSGAGARILDLDILPAVLHRWTEVSSFSLIMFFATAITIVVRSSRQPNATGRGFLWAAAAAFLAFHRGFASTWATIFLPTAGLLLVASVVEATYYMAYRDALTGLPTRRGLGEAMLRLTGRYTVAMVDVDHFKRFNDEYGHDIGDQVLKMVSAAMGRVSGGGEAFRYGGEEFTILFPGIRAIDAKVHLEKLREKISHSSFVMRGPNRPKEKPESLLDSDPRGKSVTVTVSIGVAERTDRRAAPSEILQQADKALYRAKQSGRNQVRLFDR